MSLRSLAKRVGWRRHLRRGRVWIDGMPDRILGIETAGPVAYSALGFGADRGIWYEASPWRTLSRALPRGTVSPLDVFADFGCGKGRILLLAARYPFGRVIGVELSPNVAEVARRNIARLHQHLACADVQVVVEDVAEFAVPDDLTVAFCFNPVTGEVFSRLLSNLCESVARNPRILRLIYLNPTMHELVREAGWREERRVNVRSSPDYRDDLAIYRYEGTA